MSYSRSVRGVDAKEAARITIDLPDEGDFSGVSDISDVSDVSGDEGSDWGENETYVDLSSGEDVSEEVGDTKEEESADPEVEPPAKRRRLMSTSSASPSAVKEKSKKKNDYVPVWGDMDGTLKVSYPQFKGSRHGPTEAFESTSPIQFFEMMWPNTLVDHIVTETNRYHQDNATNTKTKKPKTWFNDTTAQEIKAFLGCILFMGIIRAPEITDYFACNDIINVGTVAKVFSKHRFMQLWGNLHLANNKDVPSKTDPGYDKLYKLRPLLNTLQTTFRQYIRPGQNCAVDEHMVKGKGRNPLKQYMPKKPIKRGTKIWELGCSCCGYIYNFQIYAGAQGNAEHGLSHRVVMDLASTLPHKKNHVIYFDNFFSSFQLLKDLRGIGMYGVGTIRPHKVGYPPQFKDETFLAQMKKCRGEFHSFAENSSANTVLCTVWSDTKMVAFVTNAHSAGGNDTVERKKSDGTKIAVPAPSMIKDYNKNMGAVDLHDQLQQSYEPGRKSSRWWLRIFLDFLNAATVNAYIMYKLSREKANRRRLSRDRLLQLSHKNFRVEVIRSLIGKYTCRKRPGPDPVQLQPAMLFRDEHTSTNLLKAINYPSGRCVFCCLGKGALAKRKETMYGCVTCKKRLCPGKCHDAFHRALLSSAEGAI